VRACLALLHWIGEVMSALRILAWVTGGIGVLLSVYFVGVYVFGSAASFTAPFRGEVEKREQVEAQGEYRIAKYDYFHDLCQDIQAKNEEIALAEEQIKVSSGEEKDKLEDSLYATRRMKIELVGDYNAEAAKDYTAGQFRDSDLPAQIDPDAKEVQCG
jgi:hypothetical protein